MKSIDYIYKKYTPQKRRNLKEAIGQEIAQQFPRIGGPRIQRLCSELILDVVDQHLQPRERLQHGQVLWVAIARDNPPTWDRQSQPTRLVNVVLDLVTEEDIDRIVDRCPLQERRLRRCLRLCEQAFDQGALLSNIDLSLLLGLSDPEISRLLIPYEKTHGLVPRRATLHDVGTGLTHKEEICRLHFQQGKQPDEVARLTFHSLRAVDRYLSQFKRIRDCRSRGMSVQEIAHTLSCSIGLVHQYFKIEDELNGEEE